MPNSMHGLVLAGGKSSRMGQDKGAIIYHQKPQREHFADLLRNVCEQVFISCRKEQNIISQYPLLLDQHHNIGPIAALLSAFEKHPQRSWLIVACDMPMIDLKALKFLLQYRNTKKIATVFENKGQIEPLFSIWEPHSYSILKDYFNLNIKSPFKILKENDVEIVQPKNSNWLLNINSKEDQSLLKKVIKNYRV